MTAHPLEQRLVRAWPPAHWIAHRVVVAVSGGPDSVALLCGLVRAAQNAAAPARLIVAHFNHGWRGAASDEDERFVGQLAASLELPFETARGEPPGPSWAGQGPEASARRARYAMLRRVAGCHGARFIATGHTRDDQVETVLHRLLRGTGLKGLAGIPPYRRLGPDLALVRPLLACSRAEVEDYLAARGQAARLDASNVSRRYARNRLRYELLPLLRRDYSANIDDSLLRLADMAGEAITVLDELVEQLWSAAEVRCEGEGVELRRDALASSAEYLVCELLAAIWRRQHWQLGNLSRKALQSLARVLRDMSLAAGRRHAPGGIELTLLGDRARLAHLSR